MSQDFDYLSAMVPSLRSDICQTAVRQHPSIPYAGVAIGDATDSSLLSTLYPDRTGTSDLFGNVAQPHLGAECDETV